MKAVRYVGTEGSRSRAYRRALRDGYTLLSTTADDHRNIAMQFSKDGRRVKVECTPTLRDFVDFAACIYVLDEIEERAPQTDAWTRDFHFVYPATDLSPWKRAESNLTSAVEFLSGDRFSLEFVQGSDLGSIGTGRRVALEGFDVVCLFSGGADSFLGACELLQEQKRVLLVGHYSEGISSSAQADLYSSLVHEFSDDRVSLVQCYAARSKIHNRQFRLEAVDRHHRMRSLLFLALGTGMASISETPSLAIPENGLIAINPPLGVSRIGSLSTRTAHPRFLASYRAAVNELGISGGGLFNPFSLFSKNDIVKAADKAFHDGLRRSVSCSKAGRVKILSKDPNVRHCGFCVPCLYRRSAFAAGGLDDPKDYARDVFRDFAALSDAQRRDFRSMVRLARRLSSSTNAQLDAIVVQQGGFAPETVDTGDGTAATDYTPWRRMLRDWANDFLAQVRSACPRPVRATLSV